MARPDHVGRVLLDSSCLLGLIKGDEFYRPLASLMTSVARGETVLVESSAIFAEVLPEHGGGDAKRRGEILTLLQSVEVQLVDVSVLIARKAGDLRVEHGLQTWDAVHLATSILAGVDVLFVRDHRFPTGTVVEGVYVSEPHDIDDDKLPLDLGDEEPSGA